MFSAMRAKNTIICQHEIRFSFHSLISVLGNDELFINVQHGIKNGLEFKPMLFDFSFIYIVHIKDK